MRYVRLAAAVGLLGALLVLLLQPMNTAQERPQPAKAASGKSLDVSYITDDFFAAIVVRPAQLWKSPGLKSLPLDQAAATVKEYLSLEPKQVEQMMLLVPRPDPRPVWRAGTPQPFPIGGVVRLGEPLANKEMLERAVKALGWGELKSGERAGKTYWTSTKNMEIAFYLPDERTIVFGSERLLGSMAFNLAPGGKLAGLVRKADASSDVLAVVDPSPIRELLAAERRHADGPEELILSVATQVPRRIDWCQFTADFSQGSRLRWEIAATSESDAELLHDLVRGWQAALKLALPAIMEQLDPDEAVGLQAEVQKLAARLATDVLSGITTSRKDDRVILQLETKGNYVEFLASAAKVVAKARERGPTAQSMNNLRQIGLAIHNYHDTYNALPAHAIYEAGKDGRVKEKAKPLLSWRVAILPFVEATSLYNQFHLDEPWDSPHNKKLIASMPLVYKSPGIELGEGKTCYLLPMINEGKYATIFPAKPGSRVGQGTTTFGSIIDGLSNTLMVVEAAPEKAVIWTKPDDWEVDLKKPKEGLFGDRKGFAMALRGDASALPVSEKVPGETLLKALGRGDGEQYDLYDLVIQSPAVERRPATSRPFEYGEKTRPAEGKTKTLILPRTEKTPIRPRPETRPSKTEPSP